MAYYKPIDSKREEFRKYLDVGGVMEAVTRALVSLYEEQEKPDDALEYIKKAIGGASREEIECAHEELLTALKTISDLEAEINDIKGFKDEGEVEEDMEGDDEADADDSQQPRISKAVGDKAGSKGAGQKSVAGALPRGSQAIGQKSVAGALPRGSEAVGQKSVAGALPRGSEAVGQKSVAGALPRGSEAVGQKSVAGALPRQSEAVGDKTQPKASKAVGDVKK